MIHTLHKSYFTKSLLIVSIIVTALIVVASLLGLLTAYPYSLETENWRLQAQGQDIGNLLGAVVFVLSALLARRGSLRAYLVWFGTLFYFVYAYIIYAFAVHFTSMFLLYVAILCACLYTLVFAVSRSAPTFSVQYGRNFAGYTLISIGLLFGFLWLAEILPATFTGDTPQGIIDAGLVVNPVHSLDLSLVLPAFILTGVLILRNQKWGIIYAAPWLLFCFLMGSSIVAAMLLMANDGLLASIAPLVMVSAVVLVSIIALMRLLRNTLETTTKNRTS